MKFAMALGVVMLVSLLSLGWRVGIVVAAAVPLTLAVVSSDPASTSDEAPDLRVIVSGVEIGAAWRRTSKDNRSYHSVKLDDPSFTAPIHASLFKGDDATGEGNLLSNQHRLLGEDTRHRALR